MAEELIQQLWMILATGGASGGGDDNPRDWKLPKGPDDTSDTSAKRRRFWPGGARPKEKGPEEMRFIPKEKSGLPPSIGRRRHCRNLFY